MKKEKKIYKRILAFLLAAVLFLDSGDFAAQFGENILPSKVEAASAYDKIFSTMVTKNITNRLTINYQLSDYTSEDGSITNTIDAWHSNDSSSFPTSVTYTEEEVLAALKSSKTDSAYYSTINITTFFTTLLGNGAYQFYLDDGSTNRTNFIEVNKTYLGTSTQTDITPSSLTTANPWTSKVICYDNSPLTPGLDYSDQSMSTSYTVGQLIVDYMHANYTPSSLLSDDRIIALYNRLAEEAESPFVELDTLQQLILAEVNSGKISGADSRDHTSMLDMSDMITYQDYVLSLPEDSPIPSGTLFIGTWLIDAQSITEPFYRMALQSMTTYNQQVMLYKSELSSGYWKNIYSASGLDAILPVSDNVPEYDTSSDSDSSTSDSMAGYYIDIVVGSDGIPRKAKMVAAGDTGTSSEVDVFTLIDPYELDTLPELTALKAMLDAGVVSASDTSSSDKYIFSILASFFAYDQKYDYSVTDINDPNYSRTTTLTKEDFETGCKYILSCAQKTDIAFWAADPNNDNRIEESGRGFLSSLEQTADWSSYADSFIRYNYQGHPGYSGKLFELSRLMVGNSDGTFGWKGENDWIAEIKALPKALDTFNQYSQIFRKVWIHRFQVHDEVTDEVDNRMSGMKGLYRELCLTGSSEDKELAYEAINVENSLDALRRYEAYYNLVENENANFIIGPGLLSVYECVSEGSCPVGFDYNLRWHTSEDFVPEDTITTAVEEAIVSCTESMYDYEQQALMRGTTIASQLEYDLSNDVIDGASSGAANVRPILRQLVDLDNITNNVIAHKTRELAMVNDTLLPTADAKFASYVHEGAGEDYQRAASYSTTTQAALDEILKDQKAGVSSVAAELQSYIKAKAMRLSTEDAIAFINDRIDVAESLRSGISTDAFGTYAEEALDDHIRWLEALLATVAEGGSLEDDGSEYSYSIEDYEAQLLDALNNGDLDAAENVERKLAEAARNANANETAGRDVINDPNASASDKANASDVNTPSGMADKLYNDAEQKIEDSDWDQLSDDIEALKDLGSPKLEDLLPELETKNAPASIINQVEEAIQELPDSDFSDHYGTTNPYSTDSDSSLGDMDSDTDPTNPNGTTNPDTNSSGTGGDSDGLNTGGLTAEKIDLALEDAFGKEPADMSADEAAAAIAAISSYEDVHDDEDDSAIDDYIADLLQELIDSHNVFLYRQYVKDTEREYVSLAAVSRCRKYTKFRLVEKDGLSTMTQIAGGSASYSFEVGTKGVVTNSGKEAKMDVKTVSQTDNSLYGSKLTLYPYISETSSGKYLYCTCAYIKDTEWAVLITPSTDKKIAQLLDMLDIYADEDF